MGVMDYYSAIFLDEENEESVNQTISKMRDFLNTEFESGKITYFEMAQKMSVFFKEMLHFKTRMYLYYPDFLILLFASENHLFRMFEYDSLLTIHIRTERDLFPGVDDQDLILFIERYLDFHKDDERSLVLFPLILEKISESVVRLNIKSLNQKCLRIEVLFTSLLRQKFDFKNVLEESNLSQEEIKVLYEKALFRNFPEWTIFAKKLEMSLITPTLVRYFEDLFGRLNYSKVCKEEKWRFLIQICRNFSRPFEMIKDLFPKYADYFFGDFLYILFAFPDFDPCISNGVLFRQFSSKKEFCGMNHIILCNFGMYPSLSAHLSDASLECRRVFLKLIELKTSSIISYLENDKLSKHLKILEEIPNDDFSLVGNVLFHVKSALEVELIRSSEVKKIFQK